MRTTVISLGGSIISPNNGEPNNDYIRAFATLLSAYIPRSKHFVIVTGGGSLARRYQDIYRQTAHTATNEHLDAIGIRATHVHAELLSAVCSEYGDTAMLTPPIGSDITTIALPPKYDFLVAGGCKIGVSTDYIAVALARRLECACLVNISDVPYIYSEDPRINPQATPLTRITWDDYNNIVVAPWEPGGHMPLDPFAAAEAKQHGISLQCISSNLDNIATYLDTSRATGTFIGDEMHDDEG